MYHWTSPISRGQWSVQKNGSGNDDCWRRLTKRSALLTQSQRRWLLKLFTLHLPKSQCIMNLAEAVSKTSNVTNRRPFSTIQRATGKFGTPTTKQSGVFASVKADEARRRQSNTANRATTKKHQLNFDKRRSAASTTRLLHSTTQTELSATNKGKYGQLVREHEKTTPKKRVTFSTINTREYGRTIGEQTSADSIPLTSSWEYTARKPICIGVYEKNRPRRRSVRDLYLSAEERRTILEDFGVSIEVLNSADFRLCMERRLRDMQIAADVETRMQKLQKCLSDRPHLLKYI